MTAVVAYCFVNRQTNMNLSSDVIVHVGDKVVPVCTARRDTLEVVISKGVHPDVAEEVTDALMAINSSLRRLSQALPAQSPAIRFDPSACPVHRLMGSVVDAAAAPCDSVDCRDVLFHCSSMVEGEAIMRDAVRSLNANAGGQWAGEVTVSTERKEVLVYLYDKARKAYEREATSEE